MSTTRHRILLALLAAVVFAVPPRAQEPNPNSQLAVETANDQVDTQAAAQDETPNMWFVELASPPTADGSSSSQVKKEKADFRAAAAAAKLAYTERYAFDTLWNGLSVRVARRDVGALSRLAGVKAIYPIQTVKLAEDRPGNETDLFTAIKMTGADIVQNTLGYTGAGVRVAVMDSGIDYTHPDLGGCFGPGCRVELGYDLVGDAYTGGNTPVPDPDPMDCNGHGTHVAGIVGAKAASPGGVTGVAPGVTFHAYRVFGCDGSTSEDIMIAAMERLLSDGADVLNMSIGAPFAWPQSPTAAAATRLVNKGVSVVASAGNDGALGLYAVSGPAVGEKVIAVASFDNTAVREPYFTVTPDGLAIGYMDSDSPAFPPTSGSQPMKRTGTSALTADACAALPGGSLTGFVALIRRGTCSFYQKSINAQNAGAVGVVLYNNVAGFLSPTVAPPAGSPAVGIPVVAITAADGVTLNNRLASGPVTMTWTGQLASFPNPTGGLISSFSSYGLSPDLAIKPDIGAPGGFVFSTYPMALGGYATISGTSMASPHVAGAVALLLQAYPHTPAQAIRSILQNSAEPARFNPALGFLDVVHRQGAGMLRIDRAILATTKVEPGKLSLGEGAAGPAVRTLTISNSGDTDVTYDLRNAPALATGPNTFTVAFFNAPALVTFSAPSVTVPSGGQATVNVTVTPPTSANRFLYGGYIEAAPRGGGQVVRVPYAGFTGDYQSIQVMTPTGGLPSLAKLVVDNTGRTSLVKQPSGASYTLQGSDVAYVELHLDHESRLLRVTVQDLNGKDWHRADQEEYLPRNSASNSFFLFAWDGITSAGKKIYTVPDGQYTVTITVVKALGDENNPSDVETWTSPVITIARP